MSTLSKGQTKEDLQKFMDEAGAKYPVALDTDRKIFGNYGIGPIPDVVIVKEGKIVYHNHPARLTDEGLEAFLD